MGKAHSYASGARDFPSANVFTLFEHPLHPYTQGLLNSMPHLGTQARGTLDAIPGSVPVPIKLPTHCRFASRCKFAFADCFVA